jgi:hypothetical protein
MIKCKTYPLTKPEMDAAKKFLDENQALGYIEPTNSPYSSPFFFIKKKDGTLQPVQDYREINKWTIRDVYPIPQITHILEQLQGKTLFTALDIRWGYNNIQIKPEDRHVSDALWTVPAKCHVLRFDKFAANIPENDGPPVLTLKRQIPGHAICLHGQHSYSYQ